MNRKEAEQIFRAEVLPEIIKQYEQDGIKDIPARSEAWNDWTDALCKEGKITPRQYENWANPF